MGMFIKIVLIWNI